MRRAISILCVLAVIPLVLMFMHISDELPSENSALVREKYDTWSGVLRIWVYEGWDAGATAWLNKAISSFEKKHNGVYVQAQSVDPAAIQEFVTSGISPPDMIIFPPGLLSSSENLMELSALPKLRDGLADCADGYAIPILMGSYGWAYNRQMLDGLPASWEGVAAACAPSTDYVSRSAALVALCSSLTSVDIEIELPGLDLGLPASAGVADGADDADDADVIECRLSEDFALSESAYTDFVNGKAAAIPVTQREVKRLTALSEAGKGPDWTVSISGGALLADQILLLGIVDWPRDDLEERQALCMEFLLYLLGEDVQSSLSSTGAFPVIEIAAVYSNRNGYGELELATNLPLMVPSAFTKDWRGKAEAIAGDFIDGKISAVEGLSRLRALMSSDMSSE